MIKMALKKVEKGPSDDKYWSPSEIGDYVEGYLYKFEDGDFGKQMVLYKGYDEEQEEYITQVLPAHADLKRSYAKSIIGAFTRVEVVDIQKGKKYDKLIYDVLQDEEDAMTFPDDDEEFYKEE